MLLRARGGRANPDLRRGHPRGHRHGARLALAEGLYRPVRKRLVANLGALASRLDNLEGLAFGPPLPNGHRTLVVVADNNFSASETNQFLAFEVLP